MKPKVFSIPANGDLALEVAKAMSALRGPSAPVLVVDSPLAAAALKSALAQADWPGRQQGAPLPWCGTLEQAFDAWVMRATRDAVGGNTPGGIVLSPPRSVAMRRVELAQQLLDTKGLRASLGGSPRAALSLAGQWAELFDGWEWLEADRAAADAPHLAQDLSVLRNLHAANRRANDRAAWLSEHAQAQAVRADRDPAAADPAQVWFCLGVTPSALEVAMAKRLWSIPADAISIWSWAPVAIGPGLTQPVQSPRRLIAASTLEESAWAAVQVILDWRAQGIDDIGVVALDRKAVRRVRALLERAGESLSDRSGWALDTTVVASAVVGLNDLLIGQATTQSLLEWIHSPFVRRGLQSEFGFDRDRQRELDDALRGFGRIAAIDVADLIGQQRLPFSAAVMAPTKAGARRSLAQWVEHLSKAMEHCGLESALAEDAAGQSVIAALQGLQARCLGDDTQVSSSLWHAVLTEELSRARFVEPLPGASVRVVSLSSLSWQKPKAVLIMGADSARLPQRTAPQFFEPKRFAEMGLQNDPQQIESEHFAQFVALWRAPLPLAAIATSEKPEAEVEFSAWLQLVCADEPERAGQMIQEFSLNPKPYGTPLGAAHWPHGLPAEISVSQAQSLIDCPYQFMLAELMGLAPVTELEEDMAGPDLGSLIHLVLRDAKAPFASVQACADWLIGQIDAVLSQPFFSDRHGSPLGLPMPAAIRTRLRADALAVVPVLSQWLHQAAAGGGLIDTEHSVRRPLESAGLLVKGRIDRWERARHRLIDFKTTDPKVLAKRVGPQAEDLQLPLYAWLAAGEEASPPIDDALYVSVRRDAVTEISICNQSGPDLAVLAQQAVDRVASESAAFQRRLPIRAAGIDKDDRICEYCSVRGVCRRDESPL